MNKTYLLFMMIWAMFSCTELTGYDVDMDLVFTSQELGGEIAGQQMLGGEEMQGGYQGGLFEDGEIAGEQIDFSVG